eukprot:jgi/Undpi1/13495/HiC_scaffold_8.g03154.m1
MESKRFVLLEYLVGGTLTEQMCMRNPPPDGMMSSVVRRWQQNWQFPTKKAIDSALQLSSALSYLHCRAVEGSFVVHRDLKPENIAFGSDGRLKLFAVPKHLPQDAIRSAVQQPPPRGVRAGESTTAPGEDTPP